MRTLFRLHLIIFLLHVCFLNSAQNKSPVRFSLFLVGDAGEGDTTGITLQALQLKLESGSNSAVIFLGDNCYKRTMFGLVKVEIKGFDGGKITRRRMMSQLSILKAYKGSAYFVPGNHDWWNSKSIKRGKKHVLPEQVFVEDHLKKDSSLKNCNEDCFLPKNGEAGPVFKEFAEGKVRIIFIDTYRLLLEELIKKHRNTELIKRFYMDLNMQLREGIQRDQKIIVVGHHPIYSKGKHSQLMPYWQKWVKRFALSNSNYRPYKTTAFKIDSLLKAQHYPGIYYVSGHEHSLEYFLKDSLNYIVSGAGSKIDHVTFESTQNKHEYVKWNEGGFFEIQFLKDSERIIMHHRKNEKIELETDCVNDPHN